MLPHPIREIPSATHCRCCGWPHAWHDRMDDRCPQPGDGGNPLVATHRNPDYFAPGDLTYEKVKIDDLVKLKTGIKPLDDVLGGGFVRGSVTLLCGEDVSELGTLMQQVSDVIVASYNVRVIVVGDIDEKGVKAIVDCAVQTSGVAIILFDSMRFVAESLARLVCTSSSDVPLESSKLFRDEPLESPVI